MLLSIITPSYNRAHTLPKLYESLLRQNFTDFEWILIDDGSLDRTDELAQTWINQQKINLRFFKIKNGGKTRALNYAFLQHAIGQFTLVLDSDDYLSDTSLEIISEHVKSLTPNYIGLVGLKSYSNGLLVGEEFKTNQGTYIDIYYGKYAIKGDKLFVIETEVYKNSIVLPFDEEKYMPDNIPFINANNLGVYKLLNHVLYVGDYLDEGMTSNTKKILIENIKSHVFEKRELQKGKMLFKYKVLNTVYYIYYSLLAKKTLREMFNYSGDKLLTFLLFFPTLVFLRITRKLPFKVNKV
jgi:glycosyltransferase involved in cell wall biosynthesis